MSCPQVCTFFSKPPVLCLSPSSLATGNLPTQPQLRRGKSLLARDQDVAESGLSIFKRGGTLRINRASSANAVPQQQREKPKSGFWDHIGPGPKDAWMIYCWMLTCCIPPFLLSAFGTSSNRHHPSLSPCAHAQLDPAELDPIPNRPPRRLGGVCIVIHCADTPTAAWSRKA